MASTWSTPARPARFCVALLAALITVLGLAAAPARAQSPTVIDAVDSPGPGWQPQTVTVAKGSTVRWEFDQAAAPHTLTSSSANWSVDETRSPGGAAIEHTFPAAGTYTFLCKFHTGMTGSVTVTDEPRFDVLVFSRTTGFRHADAIDAGKAKIAEMGAAENFSVTATEDATTFTDAGLRRYEVVVLLDTDGEGILNAAQRTAFERYTQRGGGVVGIHAAANADRNWAWMGDMMGGAWFLNHPAPPVQFQQATVNVVDTTHPATKNLPQPNWVRTDEWYNFTAEPKDVHVLLKLDESTYDEQDGSAAADDHPIAWCSNYDGGRHFYTALGHYGVYWDEPAYKAHILGAIQWAAGVAGQKSDCGPDRPGIPTDAAFDKVTLDDNTENPMEIAVADDGRVYYVELGGKVKRYDPANSSVRTIGTIPVHRGNENGLLGIALDPNFTQNKHLYLFYSPVSPEVQHVSRFTLAADGTIDMASEKLLLEFPHQRIVCCHSSGSLAFGPGGELFISTGDDTEHAASQGFAPLDDDVVRDNPGDNPDADHAYDSRRTSGNTNDLRGKILRIVPKANPSGAPGPGNTYDIPAGNLYGLGGKYAGVAGKTRPEIYTMGHRNSFRIQVDQETGWVYNGEVGPDANADNANRGPRGYDEINQIREAGNMGWPYCIADNKAYREWTFPNGPAGPAFDCSGAAGGGPTNTSNYNTGLTQTPPTTGAMLWWPYGPSPDFPQIPDGPGRTAIAGPVYHFDSANPSATKFPAYYDDKVFFADWSRDWVATVTLDAQGKPVPGGIERFMPGADFRHPHDMAMGKDGSLYILEWGKNFNYAGSGVNPDSGLYRIDYAKGTRTPVARASADKDSGPAPLTVAFSSEGSDDADGDTLTYSWDFDDGTPAVTGPSPTHTFQTAGTYTVRLTATDSTGKSGTSTVIVTAGNTRPKVELTVPVQGGIFDWGDQIPYTVTVTDPEDATIDCDKVTVNPGIFHDEGGNAHVHPGVSKTGCTGTFDAPSESGHEKSANIALVLTATYTDTGGQPGSSPLEGASTRKLNPKTIQAEHYAGETGTQLNDRPAAEGGKRVGFNDAGEWIYFEPVSLKGIDKVTVRYTSGGNGGLVDFRLDAPDGPVVGTADLPNNGGWDNYSEVTAALSPPDGDQHRLYLAYRARPGMPGNDLFDLDELRFGGKGVASNSAPTASAQASKVTGGVPLNVSFTGTGSDPDGDALTYGWDFTSDGTVDATTANASHTYTEPGTYTATFTVSDGGRSRSAKVSIAATPPVESCPGDDEFEGSALNRDRWQTVVREDPAFMNVGGGALNITAQPGQDIHAGDTGLENIVLQDLPDSGPWTATALLTWNPTTNYQNAGLMVYTDDRNFIKTGMVWSNGRQFEAFKELNNTPQGLGATGVLPGSFPSTFYIRVVNDGTSVQAQRSADGVTWQNTGAATNLNGLANPKIGVYATASTAGGAQSKLASFDWFKLEAPQEPSDEFDGTALNLCRWTANVRHNAAGYTVGGGKLTLPAAHGDFFANGTNDNPNIILQPAPAGPWTAETRMTFLPNENYEQAGLLVYGDDANYVKADLVHANGRGMEFLREVDNVASGFGGFSALAGDAPATVDVRITSDGTTLRAFYRHPGDPWKAYGEPAPLAGVPNPKIGVYANDSGANVTTRDDAVFDFFRLKAGLPDTAAPVTTHTLSPAAPDGQNGWYRSNVGLTLATESGATTEYRIGNGAFQAYSGPVTLSGEGTTTVTYRSTDAELNREADKTVTVKIDKTRPTSAATLDPAQPGPGGTYDGAVKVSLAGDDAASGSGLDKLEYRVDGGEWTAYATAVTVTGDGAHTVEHRAADKAGNQGETGTVRFTIATAAPGAPTVEGFADPSTGPAPLKVRFSATGLDPDGGAVTYEWEFENGTVLGPDAEYTFTEPGVHKATVTVTDDEGDTASDEVEVTVTEPENRPPTVTASVDKPSGPAPHKAKFTATGADPDGPAAELEYLWDFGDGTGASLERSPEHTYLEPGSYTATVTVTDAGGESGTAEVPVTVTDPPGNRAPTVKAAAAPKSGNAPLDVLLSAQGSDPDGDELTYAWDFGDGQSGAGAKVWHTYRTPGTFTAKVTATDPDGLSATATVQVVVGNPPGNQAPTVKAAADPTRGTAPLTVRLSASGRDPERGALMYVWEFGDGGKAGGPTASHTYTTPGTYTAKVTVTDVQGASGTATVTITVAAPKAQVKGASAELAVPRSLKAFGRRGVQLWVTCPAAGSGRAAATVSRATARRAGLARRTLASRRLSCAAGKRTAVRLKPARSVARRIGGLRRMSLTVRVRLPGAEALQRRLVLRGGGR